MFSAGPTRSRARDVLTLVALASLLAACGGGATAARSSPTRSGPARSSPARPSAAADAPACAATTVDALIGVAHNVYDQGTAKAARDVLRTATRSTGLAAAVRSGDRTAIRAAAVATRSSSHAVALQVRQGGRLLADAGGAPALAPMRGALPGTSATVVVSALGDADYVRATRALTGGGISVRSRGGATIVGSLRSYRRPLPARGTVRHGGTTYQVATFAAPAYPSGTVTIALTHSLAGTHRYCGSTPRDTVRRTIGHSLRQIYANEAQGGAMVSQLRRVAGDAVLARAVSVHDRAAARTEIDRLLASHAHIVRIRVLDTSGRVVADVGGPYVIAPRRTPLLLGGRRVGTATISIQDDLGYVLLARRLLGVEVALGLPPGTIVTPAQQRVVATSSVAVAGIPVRLMAGPPPRMTTLPADAPVPPQRGAFDHGGRRYDAYSFSAGAFPSGSLRVTALIPVPYR